MKICPPSLAVLVMVTALWLPNPVAGANVEWWVAPNGSDRHAGLPTAPLATLNAALDRWQERVTHEKTASNLMARLVLHDGIYQLDHPLRIQAPLKDTPEISLTIEAAPGAHPILSGGVSVKHWKRLSRKTSGLPMLAKDHIWVADVPRRNGKVLEFRQLWVNGQKAVRAREPNGENLARLLAWDKTNEIATIPTPLLTGIIKPGRMEMVVDQVWEIAVLRVNSIRYEFENALLTFKQPESRIEFQHPWPPVTVNARYQAPFYLANAIEFLDAPGEWFEDVAAGKLYYWPRPGENIEQAAVFAPAIETLVQIEGTLDRPATEISFHGITFAHTTWLRPSKQGHVPLQAGMFMLDAKKLSPKGMPYHPGLDNLAWIGRPPAAVSVKNAARVSFENCAFENLGSAGLDFQSGVHDALVQSCAFRDIGGNGIQFGKFSDTNVETHVPYLPADERELCQRIKISNNEISDCANEDWGCVGIAAGYVRNASIEHNHVFNLPYTGISVGWGWTKMTNAMRDNLVLANRIHHIGQRLGDLGGIYTLSAQPGTVVAENVVSDISPSAFVPDPNHWFYLYLDEGSSWITVRDNWCPAEKFLKNANGPGNVWTNNGPLVSEKIRQAAGPVPPFQNPPRSKP